MNREMIEWAILRYGEEPQVFYIKNPDVERWVNGEKYPTVKQLERFAKKVHVPFGYIFLDHPPKEDIPLSFFRTGKKTPTDQVSLNVYHTIQMIHERQVWLREYLEELDFPDLSFVGKYAVEDDHKTIVEDIRKELSVDPEWAQHQKTWEQALGYITQKIEDAGMVVTFNGVVGNNTHRPIEVEECRGFVLVDKKAPFLFINNKDAKAAQMFTLIHELAHVWLGESAGFDFQNLMPADDPVEILCDQIAAEFLVPEDDFLQKWRDTPDFQKLSRVFKVSPIVVGRRALDLGVIRKEEFFAFYNDYMGRFKNKEESSGGNFYATAKGRVSLRFAGFVNSAVKENRLLYRDAYRLTDLKGRTYHEFIKKYLE